MNEKIASSPLQILICEDDPTFQEELLRTLHQQEAFKESQIGCYSEPDKALATLETAPPDLVIMDLYFFGQAYSGVETLEKISQQVPQSRRIVLTAHIPHDPELYRLWKCGLHGYFLKNTRIRELAPKFQRILQGENIYDWMVENRFLTMPQYQPEPGPELLSERQLEVVLGLAQGQNLEEIAQKMQITYSSARSHRLRALHKLGLYSDIELVHYCFRHRLIQC